MRFGPVELIIILVIVLLLFGPSRLSKVAGELGKSIKNFSEGIGGEKKDDDEPKSPTGDDKS